MPNARDNFIKATPGIMSSPASRSFPITPSDTVELPDVTRGLWVGNTGDVTMILKGDSQATLFANVQGGSLLPLQVRQVLETGTNATSLVGVF